MRCNSKSLAPLLLVSPNTMVHLSAYSRKGLMLSSPIYGATVMASKCKVSKKAFAYCEEVLPMSPRFASAILKCVSGI